MILTLDATVILYDTKNINQVLKLFSEIPPGTTTDFLVKIFCFAAR